MKLQQLLSYVRKAVDDYQMIEEGDKIAVGISGGKDSLALLQALRGLQRFYPKKFELEAITVSLGFDNFDVSKIKQMCDDIGVNYTVHETDIGQIIFEDRKEKNPCSLCAKMRKGALNEVAKNLGCNKIALGHTKDDVVHTLLLSMFYEGRIYTFAPVTYLDRMDLYSIRPLIYAPEDKIIQYVTRYDIPVVKSPCPADKNTKREDMKILVSELEEKYPGLSERLFGSICRSSIKGWNE